MSASHSRAPLRRECALQTSLWLLVTSKWWTSSWPARLPAQALRPVPLLLTRCAMSSAMSSSGHRSRTNGLLTFQGLLVALPALCLSSNTSMLLRATSEMPDGVPSLEHSSTSLQCNSNNSHFMVAWDICLRCHRFILPWQWPVPRNNRVKLLSLIISTGKSSSSRLSKMQRPRRQRPPLKLESLLWQKKRLWRLRRRQQWIAPLSTSLKLSKLRCLIKRTTGQRPTPRVLHGIVTLTSIQHPALILVPTNLKRTTSSWTKRIHSRLACSWWKAVVTWAMRRSHLKLLCNATMDTLRHGVA